MDKPRLYVFILLSILTASCVSNRELIYLQDKNDSPKTQVEPTNDKPYRLQTYDNLNITIKAIDPKLVTIFNAVETQGGGAATEQSNYFVGYTVDDHGNIRMPIIGELNVLGYTTEEVRVKIGRAHV